MWRASLVALAAAISLLLLAGSGTAQQWDAPASILAQSNTALMGPSKQALLMNAEGNIHLDVMVRDTSGYPVTGLQAPDFSLLDEGKPQKIVSFAAFDGLKAKADPPVQMILVIDCVNNGLTELGYIRQGLTKFLRQNDGHLAQPTTIVRFAPSGVDFRSQPSTDGDALAATVDKIGAATAPKGLDLYSVSLKALVTVVNEVANQPGRKMLIWLGSGWYTPVPGPHVVTAIDESGRRADYQLMVQLAKGMEEGRISLYGGYRGADYYRRDYSKRVRKVSEADPRDLALQVLAAKSGGHGELPVINGDSAVSDVLNHFVSEASTFYSLSFDSPRARKADEFHELKVKVDRRGLKAHTITGYYDEPEYFRPEPKKEKKEVVKQRAVEEPAALRQATVAQLYDWVRELKGKRDGEAAKEIDRLQLTERLSSRELTALSAELPGAKSKAALMAVGDASVFLKPPPDEIPQKAPPVLAEQRQMMSLVVAYLKKVIPKLPDFYADRFTTAFEETSTPKQEMGAHNPNILQPSGEFNAKVYYRGGKEVVRAEGEEELGLMTEGTFGPILSTVVVDAARSTTEWSRCGRGAERPHGSFSLPGTASRVPLPGFVFYLRNRR